jgi:peptidoglycan/xylan/chitin deacetylase (PgdA/CDA1 family)
MMIPRLRRAWEKNWPELHCTLRGGMPDFVTSRKPREPGACIPVFCYHLVDAEEFGRDLEFLERNGYSTLDADQLADHMEGEEPAPPRSVVLTIDDGMRNLYTHAFPLLRQFDQKAVAFIAPGLHRGRPGRLCSWVEIEEMHLSGLVDFQSHTLEHRFIPRWPAPCGIRDEHGWIPLKRSSPLMLRADLTAARQLLNRQLRKKTLHLALPQYGGTQEAARIAKASGYRAVWWGMLSGRPGNALGDPLMQIVRLNAQFVRRLPGQGRISLASILQQRVLRRAPLQPSSLPAPSPARSLADKAIERA